jgi:arylsulfatase
MKQLKFILSIAIILTSVEGTVAQQNKRPNIILIVADDLGYSDIGCYGGEVNTPALNKLAKEGVRLNNMHNASMCVLSRSSMLTGQWWIKTGAGIKNGTNLAQELKAVGYRTGIVGKWHLSGEPNDKGFDYFFGFLKGFSSYYTGSNDYRINRVAFTDFGKDYYSTDEFTKRAIAFIEPTKENKSPFFLYLAYQSPHNPLQAPKDDIMKYRGKYLKGWHAIRNARITNQIKFGIIDTSTPLPAYPQNLPDWETLTPEQKDLEDLRMSVYAAMIERMDNGIEKLLKALEANGQKDNTFILFLSDNGTDSFSSADATMLKKGLLPGDSDSNFQPGTGWAYASVTPFRLYKISQHSGGVKTGAIAWYPKLIKNPGAIQPASLHVVDIMPTILDMAMPTNMLKKKEQLQKSMAGESFSALLRGEKWNRKSPMYFQYIDNRAIRTDKWSLIEVDSSGWELFNKKKDPLESYNIAKAHPKIVEDLSNQWLNWWQTEGGNKDYKPEKAGTGQFYRPQGDKGTGDIYKPSAMPAVLSDKYKKD